MKRSNKRVAKFFTFYSFKGGVGRSMALINTAAHLARRGRRVLVIDLDLEAPGISYLSADERGSTKTLGFVDAIYELLTMPDSSPLVNSDPTKALARYTRELDLHALAQGEDSGAIEIMPAGRLNDAEEYQRRLSAINFRQLYREGVGVRVLQHFKKVLSDSCAFDYILVDSRTGLSAEAGIAVRDLADHLIVIMGLNHQNVTGTAEFLRTVRAGNPKPTSVTGVLSPMPLGEDALAEERIRIAERSLQDAWPEGFKRPLAELQIPYHPRLALEEKPHIARLTNQPLTNAYARLESHVRRLVGDVPESYYRQAQDFIRQQRWAEAINPLNQLIKFRHAAAASLLQRIVKDHSGNREFDVFAQMLESFGSNDLDAAEIRANHFAESGRLDEADRAIRHFLTAHSERWWAWQVLARLWVSKGKNVDRADAVYREALLLLPNASGLLGNYAVFLWRDRGDPDSAAEYFEKGLHADPMDAVVRTNYANFLWREREQLQEAQQNFEKALAINPAYAFAHGSYAHFLAQRKNEIMTAEKHFKEALRLDPRDTYFRVAYANMLWEKCARLAASNDLFLEAAAIDPGSHLIHGNYAEFLLVTGDLDAARSELSTAWALAKQEPPLVQAALLVLAGLVKLASGEPDQIILSQIAGILSDHRDRRESQNVNFDSLFAKLGPILSSEQQELYKAIVRVLRGTSSSDSLDEFLSWTRVHPMKLRSELF